MRLVCPNCDAEYEVDDTLVPPEGRDVQCSNCSVTWFQKSFEAEQDDVRASVEASLAQQRPQTDPKALEIIHEEVERERRARQSDSGTIETQGDLGLQNEPSQAKSAAHLSAGQADDIAPAPQRAEPTKRELFPDIEEINSTLADAPDPDHETESEESKAAKASGRSGFRIGFGLMLMLTAALLAAYVYAPELKARFPGAESNLMSYVGYVDQLRGSLEAGAQGLLAIVTDLTERIGN